MMLTGVLSIKNPENGSILKGFPINSQSKKNKLSNEVANFEFYDSYKFYKNEKD